VEALPRGPSVDESGFRSDAADVSPARRVLPRGRWVYEGVVETRPDPPPQASWRFPGGPAPTARCCEEPSLSLLGVPEAREGAVCGGLASVEALPRGPNEELIGIRIRRRGRVSRPPDPAPRSVGI